MQIKILDKELYTHDELVPKTVGSAAIDLKLVSDHVSLQDRVEARGPIENTLIGTGIAVAIPEGFVGIVCPRSSAGHKKDFWLSNTIGVIDSDYRGEIKLSVNPCNAKAFMRGEAVAQLFVVPVVDLSQATIVDDFNHTTDRNDGGFGSTG